MHLTVWIKQFICERCANNTATLHLLSSSIYTLSGRTGSALVWHTRGRAFESRLVQQVLRICRPRKHPAIPGAQGSLLVRVGGATSQLDLPSPTPLSVAGCGRLQLLVPHRATSVITASSS